MNLQVFAPTGKLLPSWLQSSASRAPRSSAGEKFSSCAVEIEMTKIWISQQVRRKETHNSTIHSPLSSCLHPSSWITVNSAVTEATRRLLANSSISNLILPNFLKRRVMITLRKAYQEQHNSNRITDTKAPRCKAPRTDCSGGYLLSSPTGVSASGYCLARLSRQSLPLVDSISSCPLSVLQLADTNLGDCYWLKHRVGVGGEWRRQRWLSETITHVSLLYAGKGKSRLAQIWLADFTFK